MGFAKTLGRDYHTYQNTPTDNAFALCCYWFVGGILLSPFISMMIFSCFFSVPIVTIFTVITFPVLLYIFIMILLCLNLYRVDKKEMKEYYQKNKKLKNG